MHFKIITTGWNCGTVFEQTLRSVEEQSYTDWEIHIVDDGSDAGQQQQIKDWCDARDDRWTYALHPDNRGVIYSQYMGVRAMDPEDEDVIVYLDLDGDMFAHSEVLENLAGYYRKERPLMTYGSYRARPNPGGPVPISAYPHEVIERSSYRQDTLNNGVRFNHLRTVKWKVLKEVPEKYYQWPDGQWLFCGSDYVVMMGCLEISGGQYLKIDEVLMIYNAVQPYPDNMRHPAETDRCCVYALSMSPLRRKF